MASAWTLPQASVLGGGGEEAARGEWPVGLVASSPKLNASMEGTRSESCLGFQQSGGFLMNGQNGGYGFVGSVWLGKRRRFSRNRAFCPCQQLYTNEWGYKPSPLLLTAGVSPYPRLWVPRLEDMLSPHEIQKWYS